MNEMVGQNCSQIIPKQIAAHHDKILRNFIENGKLENIEKQGIDYAKKLQQTNTQNRNLFFFSNQINCFIQPISEQDFGVCSMISKDILMNDYILFDDFQTRSQQSIYSITHMTKRLYNVCLKKCYKDESKI